MVFLIALDIVINQLNEDLITSITPFYGLIGSSKKLSNSSLDNILRLGGIRKAKNRIN